MDNLLVLPTDPEALMRTVTAAFEVGDLRPLFAAVHKDIVWKAASPRTNLFRFGGVHRQREGVLDVTAQIAMDYVFRNFKPREIVAKGDVVWGLFDVEAEYEFHSDTPELKLIKLEIAIRWRIQEGKIIEHQAFFDTVSLLAQRGELPDPRLRTPCKRLPGRRARGTSCCWLPRCCHGRFCSASSIGGPSSPPPQRSLGVFSTSGAGAGLGAHRGPENAIGRYPLARGGGIRADGDGGSVAPAGHLCRQRVAGREPRRRPGNWAFCFNR